MAKSANFFENLKKNNTNVCFSDKPTSVARRKTVTVAGARSAVLANLRANKSVFEGKDTEKVFANFREVNNGYQFSIKYGIRSLSRVLGGSTYVTGLNRSEMTSAFDAAIALVESGGCDAALEEAIAANARMRSKGGSKRKSKTTA